GRRRGGTGLLYRGGMYSEGRGFRETIEALPLLDDDVHFAILGFGRDRDLDLVATWAKETGVADRVHLFPPRPFTELVRTAAAATIGLVPIKPVNLGSYTGDTNKLFEYLRAGLRVVASDLPEIRRVVTEGNPPVGEVFDSESSSSIASAIRRLVDGDDYQARRQEARRHALKYYNWELE